MRITFLSHYYPPEVNAPASRTSEHCRQWAKAGHDITVITCAPNHPSGVVYPGFKNCLFQSETTDGVKVVRVWTVMAANQGFAMRSLNYLSFMVSAAFALTRLPRPELIISTSPQFFCGLAGLLGKSLRRVPWVLEIRDIWPESIVTVGALGKGIVTRGLELLESLAYRKADAIVSVTDSFVAHIAARCQGADKITVIKNGVDLELFKRGSDGNAFKRKFGLEGRFVAAYVGTHGMAHGLDTVLEAAKLLKDNPRIGFLLVGDGAERQRLVEKAATMGLTNLKIVGQLPKSDMPAIWAATDVSMILLKRADTFKKVLPSKMFEAMAMACPIVLGVEGESRELLAAAEAGIAITPESAGELAQAVERLAADPTLCARLGQQGATYVRAHFDRWKLAMQYLEFLASVLADSKAVNAIPALSGTYGKHQ